MLEVLFPNADRELDLFLLSLLVFLPAACAFLLLLIPAKWAEVQKWFALAGTCLTLTVALCALVDYYNLLDSRSDRSTRSFYHPGTSLEARSDSMASVIATGDGRYLSDDLVVRRPWIAKFDIDYSLAADGINLLMVLLTCIVVPLAVVASWKIEKNLRLYLVLLLLLQSGVLGAFLAMDLFLFYVFYEVMLVPMYFLIGLWGGGQRQYAAIKFVIYTLVGSVGLLVAIIALYSANAADFVPQAETEQRVVELIAKKPWLSPEEARSQVEVHTFDTVTLAKIGRAVMLVLTDQTDRLGAVGEKNAKPGSVLLFAAGVDRDAAIDRLRAQPICTPTFQYLIFALLFLGFAVKVPIVPLHSWLPDAHVEAPTPISMILAGVLLKLGGYGLLRFAFPFCPWAAAQLAWWIGLIGVVGIIYGAFVALGQKDFKRLLAYSSVSHMGYVVLGLASWGTKDDAGYWEWGVNGAVFQMLAHGITATGLFFVVGAIYDRAHHREMAKLGGLKEPMPVFSANSAILVFASLGLPGLCGFVGEFQVMISAWKCSWGLGTAAILATILTAAYLLWTWQRVFLGTNHATAAFPDASTRELVVLVPLVLLSIILGIAPGFLITSWVEPSVQAWVTSLAQLKP